MRTRWSSLTCLVVGGLVTLSACGGGRTRLPEQGPKTAEAVLKSALSVPLPRTLQAMSRMDSYVRGQARKADVLLRIERPGRAQFQALTPTLDLLAVLATDAPLTSYQIQRLCKRVALGIGRVGSFAAHGSGGGGHRRGGRGVPGLP